MALAGALLPGAARAQAVVPADYADLQRWLDGRVTFDTLPRRAEPGFRLDQTLRFDGVRIGEHFLGQRIGTGPFGHDTIAGAAGPGPLAVRPGPPGHNQSVAFHRGFGSNALFPLGPDGFALLSGRGEGAVAILFDHDQQAVGLRVHAQYPAPLGTGPQPGRLIVQFLRRDGSRVATLSHRLAPAIVELGWQRETGAPDIAGVLILNTDPGGVALDDILFRRIPPLG